jgi:CubicO group peptidase (beta-lactamase class C family)
MVDLQDVIRNTAKELEIPGVAVGVIDGDDVQIVCEGVTSFDHPLPVTDTTLFQIGSISKTFVGTVAMMLVDEGRLDLDEPVLTYVPELRLSSDDLTKSVTTRHLLTHRTGWVGDYFGDTGEGDDALARFVGKLAKAPQLTPVGTTYSYNNSAFNLASHVVAMASGTSYEQAVRDRILRPLDMRTTYYSTQDAITRRVAIGHRDGKPQRWTRPRAHNGAGGVLSCVDDMLRYARFHLGNDRMYRDTIPAGSLCDEVGIVWMIDYYAGKKIAHHGGTTNGYQADLRLVPEMGLAWVMLTNSDHHHQLDRRLLAALLGEEMPSMPFAPADLQQYEGRYEQVLADLDVRVDGNHLRLDASTPEKAKWNPEDATAPPVPTRLAFRDEDRVVALDMPWEGHRGEFVRGDDGAIEWFRWDGRISRRVTP